MRSRIDPANRRFQEAIRKVQTDLPSDEPSISVHQRHHAAVPTDEREGLSQQATEDIVQVGRVIHGGRDALGDLQTPQSSLGVIAPVGGRDLRS